MASAVKINNPYEPKSHQKLRERHMHSAAPKGRVLDPTKADWDGGLNDESQCSPLSPLGRGAGGERQAASESSRCRPAHRRATGKKRPALGSSRETQPQDLASDGAFLFARRPLRERMAYRPQIIRRTRGEARTKSERSQTSIVQFASCVVQLAQAGGTVNVGPASRAGPKLPGASVPLGSRHLLIPQPPLNHGLVEKLNRRLSLVV